ncbi:MAG: tripartite tricarboxylate transporter substrate binding protein [Aquisalimonadaceae bacterium]
MQPMKKKLTSVLTGAAATLGLLAMVASPAHAEFPDKGLNYINPFSPGGEIDITARWQQPLLQEYFDEDVTITYRTGGGGAVGWSHLKDQPADGYTFAGFSLPHIIAQPMVRNPGYKTEDLKLIYTFHSTPQVLVVREDSPYKTLEEFLEAAKENPGAVTIGGTGTATGNHLGAVRLMRAADINLTWIPFPGTGPTIPALQGGHVTALMTNSTAAYQNRDKFRALAVAWDERLPFMDDVPTFREQGLDVVEAIYRGVLAPADTSDERVEVLAKAFDEVNKKIQKRQEDIGAFVHFWGPKESADLVARLQEEYKEILEDL